MTSLEKKKKLFLLIALLIGFFPTSIYSNTFIDPSSKEWAPSHINIILEPDRGLLGADKAQVKWEKICQDFGKGVTIGQGPWGYGFAKSYNCYIYELPILEINKEKPSMIMTISFNKKVQEITIKDAQKSTIEAQIRLPITPKLDTILQDATTQNILLACLLDQLPFSIYINPNKKPSPLPASQLKGIGLPPKLRLYEIFYNAPTGRYISNKRGFGFYKKSLWRAKVTKNMQKKTYWGQNKFGRGGFYQRLAGIYSAHLKKNFDITFQVDGYHRKTNFKLGYVAARIGIPLTTSNGILSKANLIGLMSEVRSGPLDGLVWNWDFIPETKETTDKGSKTSLDWSRAVVGWRFFLPFTFFGADGIYSIPKIGALDFSGNFEASSEFADELTVAPFEIKNAISLGLDIGMEWYVSRSLIRLWGGNNFSGLLGDDKGSVNSLRGGLDFLTNMNFRGSAASFIAFANVEKLDLFQPEKTAVNDAKIKDLSFATAYVGVGLGLAW